MKREILIILFFIICSFIYGQDNIRLNNYWWEPYIINPAAMEKDHLAEFTLAGRKQWILFPGAPATLYASGSLYLDEMHTQFGLKILQDKIGYTSTSNISLTYAYAIRLNYNWRVHLGLALDIQMISYDLSQIKSPTQGDPFIYERLMKANYFNSDIGFEVTNKIWRFGMASQNLFSLFKTDNLNFVNTNFIYGGYREYNHDYVNLGYGISGIQYKNLYQAEINLTGYFKVTRESNAFQLGLLYRTWNELGFMFGINLSKNLFLYYNYDYDFGGISNNSLGSHEIMLVYNIEKVFKCRNCWY